MPCPFCGGPANFKHDTVSRTCWVACSRMDCAGEWCNEKDAAEFWNTRALAALPSDAVQWALNAAQGWISHAPHGDNCYLDRSEVGGHPGNRCNCGKDGVLTLIKEALSADSHIEDVLLAAKLAAAKGGDVTDKVIEAVKRGRSLHEAIAESADPAAPAGEWKPALPGGGGELTYKPEQVSNERWMRCLDMATAFMPGARDAWTRFTDKPWNKHAMHRVLAEFAAALPTPNPHEADRNG